MAAPRKLAIHKTHVEFLQHLLQVSKTENGVANRARILLLRGEGVWASVVAEQVGCGMATVWRVERRYRQEGLQALYDRPRSGRPRTISPPATGAKLVVQEEHVEFLQELLQVGKTERRVAYRARILLLRQEGLGPTAVAEQVGCGMATVWRVERRYRQEGLQALYDRPRPGRPRRFPSPSRSALSRTEMPSQRTL